MTIKGMQESLVSPFINWAIEEVNRILLYLSYSMLFQRRQRVGNWQDLHLLLRLRGPCSMMLLVNHTLVTQPRYVARSLLLSELLPRPLAWELEAFTGAA